MAYWWVFQNQTWQQEYRGGYLWAPLRKADGGRKPDWDNMDDVRRGDVIFHGVDQQVVAVSTAVDDCRSAPQPRDFPDGLWSDDGREVPVAIKRVESPLHRLDIPTEWREGEAPFDKNLEGKQGYLYALSDAFATYLLSELGVEPPPLAEGLSVRQREEEGTALLATPRRRFSQAFLADAKLRRAVEQHAVDAAEAALEAEGYEVKDVGATHPFDLRAIRNDQELHVEVKGTTTAGEAVFLTKNEVLHHQQHGHGSALFVLRDIEVVGPTEVRGGTSQWYRPWVIDPDALTPTQYRYELPER